jgi:hypothetical protein
MLLVSDANSSSRREAPPSHAHTGGKTWRFTHCINGDHDERGDQPTLVDEALELIVRMPAGAGRGRA